MTCLDAQLVKALFTLIHNETFLMKLRCSFHAALRFWQGQWQGCICLSGLQYMNDVLLEV